MNVRQEITSGKTIAQIASDHGVQKETVRSWMRAMYKRDTHQGAAAYKKLVAQAKANEQEVPSREDIQQEKGILLADECLFHLDEQEFGRLIKNWNIYVFPSTVQRLTKAYVFGKFSLEHYVRMQKAVSDKEVSLAAVNVSSVRFSKYYEDRGPYTILLVKAAMVLNAKILTNNDEIRLLANMEGVEAI